MRWIQYRYETKLILYLSVLKPGKDLIFKEFYLIFQKKINLKRSDKYVGLSSSSICYTYKNIKKSCKSNKFKILASTWNEGLKLHDESYFASDIEDYFEHITKKRKKVTENPPIKIYVTKIENRLTFKIKKGYNLHVLTS